MTYEQKYTKFDTLLIFCSEVKALTFFWGTLSYNNF